jgi:hypothetical protein
MDRRRYVPVGEGMEVRTMMSGVNVNNLFGFQVSNNLNVPITYQQKELRVQHLAYFMEKILPGRYLPATETQEITAGLTQLISQIHKPSSQVLDNYNYQLRKVIPDQSLTPAAAALLNRGYQAVLNDAKAPQSAIDTTEAALNQLVTQVDTRSPQPVYLSSNDYTIVLQTALAVGRPMPPPILGKIGKNEGIQANSNHIKTVLEHPAIAGTYHFHTEMQIITPDGTVVGEAPCKPETNKYRVIISTPLSVGVHAFRLRAYDSHGDLSRVSKLFFIKVVPRRHHPPKDGMATAKTTLTSK